MKHIRNLIPYPAKITVKGEDYFFFSKFALDIQAEEYRQLIEKELVKTPKAPSKSSSTRIIVNLDASLLSQEAYKLIISDHRIEFRIRTKAGLFYGLQTLIQLVSFNHNKLYSLEIEDAPAYEWRGLHLDVSRHFFTIDEIFTLLDRMAELKMNRFHWHLSDDQGWRIESFKYPKLTRIASLRTEQDGSFYEGNYSHEEIKQVIEYASYKQIMVIPEVDLPGHTQAILSAYPHLSCHKKQVPVWNEWGVSPNVLCPSQPESLAFIDEVLAEIIPLFPAPYFHIGGDECPSEQWEKCPVCQAKVLQQDYSSFRELQGEFNQHLANFLASHNKQMIGWDEIGDAGCPSNSLLMCWQGDASKGVKQAHEQSLKYILTPNHPYYLDWKQSNNPDELGAFGIASLADIYNYDYPSLHSDRMLGMQANIWTERIETLTKLEYMVFPRLVAVAENCWTPYQNKDFNRFLIYLKRFLDHYDLLYLNYCPANLDNACYFLKEEIITRDCLKSDLLELTDVSSIFNPGAIKLDDKFYLLMRVQNRGRETFLVRAESENGIDFTLSDQPVIIKGMQGLESTVKHIYDPRITVFNDQIYVMTALDTSQGCYLGLFVSQDLHSLNWLGFVSELDSRNGVIFPEKIAGRYARLERPNKSILANGTKSGSAIYLSYSDDLLKWDNHKLVMQGNSHYWDELIGSGPVPIKTRYGWLHIYHGVATHFASSNIYQAGFSFLDLDDPAKVLFRSKYNFLEPREYYECVGQVPNVVFPTGLIALVYDEQGFVDDDSKLFLYYGCADTSIGLLQTNLRFFIERMLIEEDI